LPVFLATAAASRARNANGSVDSRIRYDG
jgi:hypothetical protein